MNSEQFIRYHIRKILAEGDSEEESTTKSKKSKKKIVKGSIPGAIPKGFRALADADPEQLMSNLKAKGNYSHSDPVEALNKLLDSGVSGTDEMSSAFTGTQVIQNKDGKKGVLVKVGDIDNKNGTRYMKMLMQAALATDTIDAPDSIRVQHSSGGVLIYFSPNGNNTWDKSD